MATSAKEISALGTRGKALYKDLHKETTYDPLTELLIVEACRIADRLDRLNRLVEGDAQEWVHFKDNNDGDVVVYVDGLLGESRHQATTLKALVAEIVKPKAAASSDKKKPEADVASELAQRRASRRSASASSRRPGVRELSGS